jgi:Glycosyltransferase family 87
MSVAAVFSVILRDPATNRADFYTFWDSAHWLRAGMDPYLGQPLRPGAGYNLNPPFVLLVFLPFSWFPLDRAFVLWTIVGLTAYAASAWAIAREISPDAAIELIAAVLISQATFSGLQLGQPAGLLMAALTAAWIADRHGSSFVAGLLLGVAMAAKLFLGVFVFYAIWRRSGRLLGGMVIGLLSAVAIGFLPAGMAGYRSWVTVLGHVTWAAHLANASLFGFLTRILTTPPSGLHVTPLLIRPDLVRPLWYILVAIVAGVVAWRAGRSRDVDAVWLMTLVASLLCSPLGWCYYLPLAAGPSVGLAFHGSRPAKVLIAGGYACFLAPYTFLVLHPLGRLATLTLGSVYLCGAVLWFAAGALPQTQRRLDAETVQ